tara:strand:- start:333 stop:1091 length:759 start_codon:yes stop_codon:yes gene_type:complete
MNEALIHKLVFGDIVVVQSEHSLNFLKSKGIKNVRKIYPAIDVERFKPGIDSTLLRRQLNISKDHKIVLYGGNYYLGCNEDLIETILMLSKKEMKIKFILACRIGLPDDWSERERMKDVFQREGVLGNVIFLEQVKNMNQLISLSDIHIFPARRMAYKTDIPMVLLESLSTEKPIIITDISPLREIMKDDVGEIVPVGDVRLLAESIIKLLKNEEVRREKGKKGRKMVKSEFSINDYILKYSQLYEELNERE